MNDDDLHDTAIAVVGMAARVPDDVFEFDAGFFSYSDAEAAELDPQHRLFLECAYHAVEDAGYALDRWDGVAGLYGAANLSWYLLDHVYPRAEPGALFGNLPDGMAARAAYELHVTGPCLTVQAACASSLTAVHLGCQDLLGYQCDLAIAGGVSVARSGSGVGVVVLRRLVDAVRSGDHVYSVIRGTAVANDGRRRAGPVSTGSAGAREAALGALAVAGVEPDTVVHVEPHRPGDAAEAAVLREVYPGAVLGTACDADLEHASGVLTLISTVRAGWDLAAVAASGSGGAHAHVVLEHPPEVVTGVGPEWHVFPLSAKTPSALQAIVDELGACLSGLRLADVARTLQIGRRELPYRTFAVCRDHELVTAPFTRPEYGPLVFSFRGDSVSSDVLAARRLMLGGIRPVAVLGTGIGEYAAACVAGVLTLDEAAALAEERESPERYAKAVCNAHPQAGELPLLSGATGALLTEDEVTDQQHWLALAEHIHPARPRLDAFVVEVSTVVDEWSFLELVGTLWARGAEVDWEALSGPGARRVPLPGYPFARRRHWLPPAR